jgi:hypothetical protein
MTFIKNFSRILLFPMIVIMLLAGAGCKSKKKAMEAAAAADRARTEQEAALKKQREEDARAKEAAEMDRQRKEREAAEARTSEPYSRLENYFNAIAGSGSSSSANGTIQEALGLFASEDTPVLIVISESGGMKDYDRPTTIRAYLDYLKDTKKNTNKIGKLHFDGSNKIVEVELIKGR